MVSAYRADALRDPTAELRELFSAHSAEDDFTAHVTQHFTDVFSSNDAFTEIPSLDVYNPPEAHTTRSLVRFRAMVQDTSPSSEMYLRKTKSGSLGGWGVHEDSEDGFGPVDYSELRECNVLWATTVPGETEWCAKELSGLARSSLTHTPPRSHKYPGNESLHVGVHVKIYDLNTAEKLKSTDIVTFVGILDKEPLDLEAEASSDVPTLHVLFARPHEYAVLQRPYPAASVVPVRDELLEWIASEALGGDRDTAEWVLLASLARVQSRNPPLLPPSITLSHFPSPPVPSTSASQSGKACIPTLSHVLSQLLPLTRTLPLSLDMLNKVSFAPESKEEDLHSGALQLPQGSVLVITEGGVQEGKLVERGLTNISVMQEVISSQTLGYVFPFSQFSFPTDISCVVLSEGKKSAFFKTDLTVPFKTTSDTPSERSKLYKPAENIAVPTPEKLAAFRDLVVGAQQGKVLVSEATSQFIQQDFVRDRQRDPGVTSEDLIRQMTVAKLYALSLHEAELTIDVWKRAKAFDTRRKERIAAL